MLGICAEYILLVYVAVLVGEIVAHVVLKREIILGFHVAITVQIFCGFSISIVVVVVVVVVALVAVTVLVIATMLLSLCGVVVFYLLNCVALGT